MTEFMLEIPTNEAVLSWQPPQRTEIQRIASVVTSKNLGRLARGEQAMTVGQQVLEEQSAWQEQQRMQFGEAPNPEITYTASETSSTPLLVPAMTTVRTPRDGRLHSFAEVPPTAAEEPPKKPERKSTDKPIPYRTFGGLSLIKHIAMITLPPKQDESDLEAKEAASWALTHKPLWRRSQGITPHRRVMNTDLNHPMPLQVYLEGLQKVTGRTYLPKSQFGIIDHMMIRTMSLLDLPALRIFSQPKKIHREDGKVYAVYHDKTQEDFADFPNLTPSATPQSAYRSKPDTLDPMSPFAGIRSNLPQVGDTIPRGNPIEVRHIQTGGFNQAEAEAYRQLEEQAKPLFK